MVFAIQLERDGLLCILNNVILKCCRIFDGDHKKLWKTSQQLQRQSQVH